VVFTAPTYADKVRLRIAFAVSLIIQVWALYAPRGPSVQTGLPLDKVVHLGLFCVVTWLGLRLGYRWIVAVMIGQAALSELVQLWFMPQRSGDWGDLLADLVGIALAVVITLTTRRNEEDSCIPLR
jgi:VanZ family protein